MTNESRLQVRLKDGESSLSLSKVGSGLIGRGLNDAAMLAVRVEAESEEQRYAAFDVVLSSWLRGGSTEEVRKNAETGDAEQQNILAFRYIWGYRNELRRDPAESARWFRKAADQGYAPAQFYLGFAYDTGQLGVVQDHVEAVKWYRKAADQGFYPAQLNLGVMYDKGEGVAQDHVEAANLYFKAADQGLCQAQFKLGVKYTKGEGVAQDHVEAANWYRKAADQGLGTAQFNIGLKYNNGEGVPEDWVQAYMWMTLAVAHASVDGGKRYAALRDRVAVKMNPEQIAEAQRLAARWYRKSADLGKAWDQFNLGVMYDNGVGVEQDYAEAAKWYRKAADQGYEKAQFNLGLKYDNGQGVAKDYTQAHMWMTLAAAPDYSGKDRSYAATRDRVAAKMTPSQIAEAQRRAREWKRTEATQE